jgi:hypothetical protein
MHTKNFSFYWSDAIWNPSFFHVRERSVRHPAEYVELIIIVAKHGLNRVLKWKYLPVVYSDGILNVEYYQDILHDTKKSPYGDNWHVFFLLVTWIIGRLLLFFRTYNLKFDFIHSNILSREVFVFEHEINVWM